MCSAAKTSPRPLARALLAEFRDDEEVRNALCSSFLYEQAQGTASSWPDRLTALHALVRSWLSDDDAVVREWAAAIQGYLE